MGLKKKVLWVVVWTVLAGIFACDGGGKSTNDGGGGSVPTVTPAMECDRYLHCLSAADSSRYAVELQLYDKDSSCWKSGAATSACKSACTKAYGDLKTKHSWLKECGGSGKPPTCVAACDDASDCSTPFPLCVNSKCVMCQKDADCNVSLYKGGCNTKTNLCATCKSDAHCITFGAPILTGKCATSGHCLKCDVDSDCTALPKNSFKYCGSDNSCAYCKSATDCKSNEICTRGGCNPYSMNCTKDDDCKISSGTPLKCKNGKCLCTDSKSCGAAFGTPKTGKWQCK